MAGNLFLLSNIFLCAYSIELGRLINRPHLKHTPHPTNPIPSSHSIVKATHRVGCIYFYLYGSTTLYFQTLNCWGFFWGGGFKFLYYGPLKRSQLSFDFLLEEKQLSNQRVVESTAPTKDTQTYFSHEQFICDTITRKCTGYLSITNYSRLIYYPLPDTDGQSIEEEGRLCSLMVWDTHQNTFILSHFIPTVTQ